VFGKRDLKAFKISMSLILIKMLMKALYHMGNEVITPHGESDRCTKRVTARGWHGYRV